MNQRAGLKPAPTWRGRAGQVPKCSRTRRLWCGSCARMRPWRTCSSIGTAGAGAGPRRLAADGTVRLHRRHVRAAHTQHFLEHVAVVLAQQRRRTARRGRRARELPRPARVRQRGHVRCRVVPEDLVEAPRLEMRVEQQLGVVQDGPGRHAHLLQPLCQLAVSPPPRERRQRLVQSGPVPPARGGVRVAFVAAQCVGSEHSAQGRPLLVCGDGDCHPGVESSARVEAMRRHVPVPVADSPREPAVHSVVHQRLGRCGAGGLGLGHVHELAPAGARPVNQRRDYREHGVFGGGVVGIGHLGQLRRPSLVPCGVAQSRRRFRGRPYRAECGPRPGEAVAGRRHEDHIGP